MISRRAVLRAAGGAAVALALVPLCACTSPRRRLADLAGVWRDDDGIVVLRLYADGSGRGAELPTQQGPATGACRWRIDRDGRVVVDFSHTPGALVSTQSFDVAPDAKVLSYGDPSNDITVAIRR